MAQTYRHPVSSLKAFFWGWVAVCMLLSIDANAQQSASSTTRPVAASNDPLLITFALTPEQKTTFSDTLPNESYRMYDPSRKQTIDYGTLGNLGSAARPLLFENQAIRGLDVGVHAFDLYLLKPEQLGFFRNTRTFSDLSFSQGRNQLETNLNARFARTFEGGTCFSLEYRTLNNLGQYRHQRDRHNALLAGLWVPFGKRYEGFLIFSRNVIRQQDNGGIVSDEVFGSGQFAGPIAAEVLLPRELAKSRLDEQTLHYTQHVRLLGKNTAGKRLLRASHTFALQQEKYKFTNPGSGTDGLGDDAAFFDPIFLTDPRGLRHFLQVNSIHNTFTFNTLKTKSEGRPSDLLAVGLSHTYFRVMQEPTLFRASNLFATGKLAITPSERFQLNADAALGLLDNIGEYQVQGTLQLGLGKAGRLRAGLLSQIRPPMLLGEQLFVSKRLVWQQDFAKLVENTLTATYALPQIGLELSARAHLVNNYVYFDQRGVATQATAPIQVTQFLLQENFNLGKVRFENTFALQQPNRDDVLRLPTWFSKNSVFFSGKVFKKRMQLDAGFDFRINSAFMPDAYQPLVWQFHLQDDISQKPYPWLDIFASFKVQSFRGFARYENFMTVFDNTQVYYQTARHAWPFGALRFGIAWRFMDENLPDNTNSGTTPTGIGTPSGGGRPRG